MPTGTTSVYIFCFYFFETFRYFPFPSLLSLFLYLLSLLFFLSLYLPSFLSSFSFLSSTLTTCYMKTIFSLFPPFFLSTSSHFQLILPNPWLFLYHCTHIDPLNLFSMAQMLRILVHDIQNSPIFSGTIYYKAFHFLDSISTDFFWRSTKDLKT